MTHLVNAYCTVQELPAVLFPHRLIDARNRTDADLKDHLTGFVGYVMKDGREMNSTRFGVVQHIQRVQHQLSFEVDTDRLDELVPWGRQANAIFFMPDGAVTDPGGLTLVDPTNGSADPEARLPYPGDAIARKQQHEAWLRDRSVRFNPALPPTLGISEVQLRSPRHVADRMMALTLVAIKAESFDQPTPIPTPEMQERFPSVFDALTPTERAFMHARSPAADDIVRHRWRYEAADTLRWALGRSPKLIFPNQICSVAQIAADLVRSDPDEVRAEAALRPVAELLGNADLHLRLHWAARQDQAENRAVSSNLNAGVVQQRHHALNWLIGFAEADWDDVPTPT